MQLISENANAKIPLIVSKHIHTQVQHQHNYNYLIYLKSAGADRGTCGQSKDFSSTETLSSVFNENLHLFKNTL